MYKVESLILHANICPLFLSSIFFQTFESLEIGQLQILERFLSNLHLSLKTLISDFHLGICIYLLIFLFSGEKRLKLA